VIFCASVTSSALRTTIHVPDFAGVPNAPGTRLTCVAAEADAGSAARIAAATMKLRMVSSSVVGGEDVQTARVLPTRRASTAIGRSVA
jgi:hypothetical protein